MPTRVRPANKGFVLIRQSFRLCRIKVNRRAIVATACLRPLVGNCVAKVFWTPSAFDAKTGAELWQGRLAVPGVANPTTYTWNGEQHVVI